VIRALVILLVVAIVLYVARRVWIAVLQLRVGAVPEGVEVPDVPLVDDRGWQVTRRVEGDVATVRAEHPTEGVARTWTLNLRQPGAVRELDRMMQTAGLVVSDLSSSR
jgi:hypothetical protein